MSRTRALVVLASTCESRVVAEIDVSFGFFSGLTLDAAGDLLATAADCAACERDGSTNYGGVLRVDRATGARSLVFSGLPMIGPDGLAVAPDGRIYVAAQETEAGYASGVVRIDPENPGAAAFVAIGDDTAPPIDRTDIVSAADVAIESSDGPLFVLDERYRGASLQDELRLLSVDLAGAPTSNQTLLTEDLEGINRDRSSGFVLGIEVSGGTIYTLDHVFSSGSSSGRAGIVAFTPGVSSAEGTHLTDTSAFYYPSGLAIVPEPDRASSGGVALLACAVAAARRAQRAST